MKDTLLKVTGDILSSSVIIASLTQYAPLILAVPSACYACLRIWDWWEHRVEIRGKKNQAAYISKYRREFRMRRGK